MNGISVKDLEPLFGQLVNKVHVLAQTITPTAHVVTVRPLNSHFAALLKATGVAISSCTSSSFLPP